jgi:hypothetical protein
MKSGLSDYLEKEELRESPKLIFCKLCSRLFSSGSGSKVIYLIWMRFKGEFLAVDDPVGSDDSAVD